MNKYEGFVGKVLDGRYKILELVGVGGMACVLKAQDLVMNRIVAIKILNDEYNGDESAEARFIDESKAVAMLSNKNIVSVYDVAIYPDIKYIVMEYLDGITLREYLDNKGAIGWKEACIYILQILRALEHAHSKGIIHRDIKPQNVILMRSGDIKVTDFGIAKLPNDTSARNDEKAIGTVYYISPEQACGKETDYYSDIYSVGVMLYEAVTGTLPFIADTPMEVAMMQVNNEPVNPRDIDINIPVGVSQIILKAMEKSPSDRFTSAHSMSKAIEWVLRNPDVIFSMSSSAAEESPVGRSTVVSIDMIDTTEIQPYGDEEIAESLGKKQPKTVSSSGGTKKNGSKQNTKRTKKPKKASRSMFPIIVGVTMAFLLVVVALGATVGIDAVKNIQGTRETEEAEFPNIVNELYSQQLVSNLRNGAYGAKFAIDNITYDHRDDLENNTIISTEPPAGHLSRPDSSGMLHFTSVTVNRSSKVFVPYLKGYSKSYAETMLKNLELKVEIIENPTSDNDFYYDNQVLDTLPAGGAELKVGETVTVYVRSRPSELTRTAKMPNCIGMTEAEARRFAETYSLYKVEIEEVEAEGGKGRVVKQSIEPGTVSKKDTVVVMTVEMPLKAELMKNLIGCTYEEAKEMFKLIFPVENTESFTLYFTAPEALRDKVMAEGMKSKELFSCGDAIRNIGCKDADIDDGTGIIVFQSYKSGGKIDEKTTCDIIIVMFEDGDPKENSKNASSVNESSKSDTSKNNG